MLATFAVLININFARLLCVPTDCFYLTLVTCVMYHVLHSSPVPLYDLKVHTVYTQRCITNFYLKVGIHLSV